MKSFLFTCLLVISLCHSHYKLRRNGSDDDYDNKKWDWRDHYPISSIDNELITNCSTSYLFAALGGIESYMSFSSTKYIKLSAQEYLDCSSGKSCSLGFVSDVLDYYSEKKVCKSSSYEYNGKINECQRNKCESYIETPKIGYYTIKGEDSIELDIHVTLVPTKIYIDSLRDYKGGIYKDYDACDHEPNHWVLVVGYGVEGNDKYWIIKNDFGEEWGEKGYLRLERGKGMCGIGTESYSIYDQSLRDYLITAIIVACVAGFLVIVCCCCVCIMCITGTTYGICRCCCVKKYSNIPSVYQSLPPEQQQFLPATNYPTTAVIPPPTSPPSHPGIRVN